MPPRASKRNRALPSFGAPTDADHSFMQHEPPLSAASSTRHIPATNLPSLTTLCARKFAANFVSLRNNEALWNHLSIQLKTIPDTIIPKVFNMLRTTCPTYLKHEFIVTYLLRGSTITLTDALPGVNQKTICDISRFNVGVRELEISGFKKISDNKFAAALQHLTNLRVLVLRGCSQAGTKTVSTAAKSCPDLKVVNLNYTSAGPASVGQLVNCCASLECLKVAGIHNWASTTDATFANFLHAVGPGCSLPNLRTLKVRQTDLGDTSISALVGLCPNLQRLDSSFTLLKRATSLLNLSHTPLLEKLLLTSTSISPLELRQILPRFSQLRTLSLGALGISRGLQASIVNTTAMTMDDTGLRALTDALAGIVPLEHVSLVGNTKLRTTTRLDSALADFVRRVGRKLMSLNLAGISGLRSADLVGLLLEAEDDRPSLETFVLNNTAIDDDAGIYISTCGHLRALGVAGTRMTSDGLFPILDACPNLQSLDLTSCRGINVVERRRFFEVWQEQRPQ